LISNFEGFVPRPYNDAPRNGNCTIGYGTLLHMGPCTPADFAAYPNGITRAQAEQRLQNEANTAAQTIDNTVHVPLTANQRDALTSFIYNVGTGAFRGSTLLRDLNGGNYQAAADQLRRWVNQNGHPVPGLVSRRNAERCYFLNGTTACRGQLRDARQAAIALAATRIGADRAQRASITVAPPRVTSGKRAAVSGRGYAPGRVRFTAFVPEISPYRAVSFAGHAGHTGRLSFKWRTPRRLTDSLRWQVLATQGKRTAKAYVLIRGSR
jgi:lysozyme